MRFAEWIKSLFAKGFRRLAERVASLPVAPEVWIPLIVCLGALVCLFSWIPAGYHVRVLYEVRGESKDLDRIPGIVEQELTDLGFGGQSPCHADRIPTRVQCEQEIDRRSSAERLKNVLLSTLPAKIGWIPRSVLASRMAEKRKLLEATRERLDRAESRSSDLEATTRKTAVEVAQLKRNQEQLKTDLENRSRQLEIVEEAIKAGLDAKTVGVFEQKREEIRGEMDSLKGSLAALEGKIAELSKSLDETDRARQERDRLRMDVEGTQARIASLTSVLNSKLEAPVVPDPDFFQLTVIPSGQPVSHQETGTVPFSWALISGFLVFVALRRNPLNPFEGAAFRSSDDVVRTTGLPLLATLR